MRIIGNDKHRPIADLPINDYIIHPDDHEGRSRAAVRKSGAQGRMRFVAVGALLLRKGTNWNPATHP